MSKAKIQLREAIGQQRYMAHVRKLGTVLNMHFAGVGLLALLNIYLLIHMAFAWQAARSRDAAAIARQTSEMQAAEQAARPLRGLDSKLTQATASADNFYERRLPFADSQIVAELGALAKKQGVKLSRVQNAYSPVLEGVVGEVTEVRMDASLTGEYRPLVLFMNSLERDRMFFYISGVTLSGQQSGTVNLRIKLTSYLRPARVGESSLKTAGDDGTVVTGEVPQ